MNPNDLDLRDHLAIQAMLAMLRKSNVTPAANILARDSYAIADAMLKARATGVRTPS